MGERTINVTVRAGARSRGVETRADGSLLVKTTVAPEKGKANADVVEQIADHFDVPKSCVEVVRGHTSSKKILKISA